MVLFRCFVVIRVVVFCTLNVISVVRVTVVLRNNLSTDRRDDQSNQGK